MAFAIKPPNPIAIKFADDGRIPNNPALPFILYRATIDDQASFVRPWTIEMAWVRTQDGKNEIYDESACYEGNYALTDVLAGARAQEKARGTAAPTSVRRAKTTTP